LLPPEGSAALAGRTLWCVWEGRLCQRRLLRAHHQLSLFTRLNHGANDPNHIEDARNAALIEGMDVEAATNGIRGHIGLRI
jgi:hypothetical protein